MKSDEVKVREFNSNHPIGTAVRYWKGARSGQPSGEATTRTPAALLGGHTAVVWVVGEAACIALTHVEVIRDEARPGA